MTSENRVKPNCVLDSSYFGKNGGNLGGNKWGMFMNGPVVKRYQQSKLATCSFHYMLDDKLRSKGSKVKTVLAHPGLTQSNMTDDAKSKHWMLRLASKLVRQTTEDGSMSFIHAMCSLDVQSGDFYGPKEKVFGPVSKVKPEKRLTENKQMCWTESCKVDGDFVL